MQKGSTASPEIRAKLSASSRMRDPVAQVVHSAAMKARWQDSAYRDKVIAARTGLKRSEVTRRRMREAHKNRSIEYIENLSNALKGKPKSEEHKAKLSGLTKTRMADPERREAQRNVARTLWNNPAFRAGMKARWADPDSTLRKALSSPEYREKLGSAQVASYAANPARRERVAAVSRARWADPEFRAKMMAVRANMRGDANPVWRPEVREKIALLAAKRKERWPNPKTCLEYALERYLKGLGLEFAEQRRFGRYVVDAFVPATAVAYEADGSFWHRDEDKEAKRDVYLQSRGVSEVIHLNENQLAGLLT